MTALALPVEFPDLSLRGRDDRSNPDGTTELLRFARNDGTPSDGHDDLRTKLISLAQWRGLNETAALISRLTDEQVCKLAGQSHRWRDILTKRGMKDVADQLSHATPLSATDRVFLLLAAALAHSPESVNKVASLLFQPGTGPHQGGALLPGLPATLAPSVPVVPILR